MLRKPDFGASRPKTNSGGGGVAGLTADQKAEIREAFELFDADRTGAVDYHELKVAMRALGFDARKEEVRALVEEHGGENGVDFEAFEEISCVLWGRFFFFLKKKKTDVATVFFFFCLFVCLIVCLCCWGCCCVGVDALLGLGCWWLRHCGCR
jgi:hypothetical protein